MKTKHGKKKLFYLLGEQIKEIKWYNFAILLDSTLSFESHIAQIKERSCLGTIQEVRKWPPPVSQTPEESVDSNRYLRSWHGLFTLKLTAKRQIKSFTTWDHRDSTRSLMMVTHINAEDHRKLKVSLKMCVGVCVNGWTTERLNVVWIILGSYGLDGV